MEDSQKELTMEELAELIRQQKGDFMIYIEPGGDDADADTGRESL